MLLTREEVEHIADLARLALTDEEKGRFRQQLSGSLGIPVRGEQVAHKTAAVRSVGFSLRCAR